MVQYPTDGRFSENTSLEDKLLKADDARRAANKATSYIGLGMVILPFVVLMVLILVCLPFWISISISALIIWYVGAGWLLCRGK